MPAVTTAWVKPPNQITGLDHLGVQAIGVSLYERLLPAITNVTDRAAYYTFYPWFLSTLEERGAIKRADFLENFRRADCLFTLIGAWHGRGQEEGLHGARLVGRDALLPALEQLVQGKTIRLSRFATQEDSTERYFKNPLGGLGQYYLGTLRDLNILRGDLRQGVKFTDQCGRPLAEAFNARVNAMQFWKAIEKDVVDLATLEGLAVFCPCRLRDNAQEHSALTDLFFNRPSIYAAEDGDRRRATLTLLLEMIEHLHGVEPESIGNLNLVAAFRSSVYAGVLPGQREWNLPAHLERLRQGWRIYQTHELLSVAIQTVFWSALDRLDSQGGLAQSRQQFGDWFADQFAKDVLGASASTEFSKITSSMKAKLPTVQDWMNANHEMTMLWELLSLPFDRADDDTHVQALKLAIQILLALVVRDANEGDPYQGWLERLDHHVTYYPINLVSLRKNRLEVWPRLTMKEWLSWLATSWGLDVHFKVALRKLRFEMKDTFRIRPSDDGLRVIGAIRPALSSPRLSQAIQILWDLNAIETNGDKTAAILTAEGRELWEAGRA